MKIGINNKVSVILPVYNEEEYLSQCLDSICNQTLKEIEIICVDDGSTDHSLQILQRYASVDSRIRVLTQQNRFAGAARNHGMEYAAGQYLAFLDGDDYFQPDMLEKMYRQAEKNQADILICNYAEYQEDQGQTFLPDRSFEELFFQDKENFSGQTLHCSGIFQITRGWAWDKLFRRDFVEACGYQFPEFRSSEDGYFVYMLMARAARISWLDEVLVTHRINNPKSLSNTKEKDWRNGFKMWQMLKEELTKQRLYLQYKQSFLNELIYFLLWYLESMNCFEAFQSCYEYIQSRIEPEFEILAQGRDYYFQEEVFDWYRQVLTVSQAEYLFNQIK